MRFAHLSDIHLGFQKRGALQESEQGVFEGALDRCVKEKVDFILIAGDMFHVNIPEMRVQRFAFAKFREVHEAGIPVYVVYGSHDFSPVSNSVIDLLEETGYITKMGGRGSEDGRTRLDFTVEPKTGAKICGISGLKAGKDIEYYENLDRAALEKEPGFKIFMFHGAITEMREGPSEEGDHMPLSMLPKGFAYYAGGHLHTARAKSFDGYPHVVYPGTPFAGHYPDLAANAEGQRRGFYMVEFEDEVADVSFIETGKERYGSIKIGGEGKDSARVNSMLQEAVAGADPEGKIVMIELYGEMASGRTTDVDTVLAADSLYERGAKAVEVSRNRLTSREFSMTPAKGADRGEIEGNVFGENIGQLKFKDSRLVGASGIKLAKGLLAKIGQPKLGEEKVSEYESRMIEDGMHQMGLEDDP